MTTEPTGPPVEPDAGTGGEAAPPPTPESAPTPDATASPWMAPAAASDAVGAEPSLGAQAQQPQGAAPQQPQGAPPQPAWTPPSGAPPAGPTVVGRRRRNVAGAFFFGLFLVFVGAFFLIRQVAPDVAVEQLWPWLSVVFGGILVVSSLFTGP